MIVTRSQILGLAAVVVLGMSSCSSGDGDSAAPSGAVVPSSAVGAAPTVTQEVSGRAILDVRTPEEYAAGHLVGAVNIGLASGSFEEQIAELPKDGAYLVYCRTGVRSAEATAIMTASGFTDVLDAGAMENAATLTGADMEGSVTD